MDKAQKESIRRWLIKAEEDLRTARIVLDDENPITDVACFHAQQCAEKALKAYLVYLDRHVEKTHNLNRLVELCAQIEPDFDQLYDSADILTSYAIITRYPDNWREIPVEEAVEAVENAEKVMQFVKTKLKI